MKDDVRGLIRAVVMDDSKQAKSYCQILLAKDKTEKDKKFCEEMLDRLEKMNNLIDLPPNIASYVISENVAEEFREDRYYLTEREAGVFQEVQKMYETSEKLDELGIRYLNSVLLYGDSGTGKTLFAKYMAYKLGLPFLYLNMSQMIDSLLGKTQKNLDMIFNFVKRNKCVFLVDEIDCIAMARGQNSDVGEMNRVVISLLQQLDKLGNDVLVVAASNRADVLDAAVMRRMSIKHEVKKLNPAEIVMMINSLLISIGFWGENVEEYAKSHRDDSQGVIMTDVIRRIAETIKQEKATVTFEPKDTKGYGHEKEV